MSIKILPHDTHLSDDDSTGNEAQWSSGPCAGLEHRFELVTPKDADFIHVLSPLVRPFRAPQSGAGGVTKYVIRRGSERPYVLHADEELIATGTSARDFAKPLTWIINQNVISASRERYVLMHAAGVQLTGVTVILPADMESGKTTTTAGLLREGYDYITDEAVAICPETGCVHPFPKTLSVDPGSWSLFPELRRAHEAPRSRQWHVPPQHLGARAVTGPVERPRLIVFPRYVRGAETALQPMRPAAALLELCRMTFGFPDAARRNLHVLGDMVRYADSVRLIIGNLDDAIREIDNLVSNAILEDL